MDNELIAREHERRKAKLAEYQNSPEYRRKLFERLKIQDACNRSAEAKIYALAACKKDPVFFINNFCWTPNDKYDQYHFPFILFPFQEDYVNWLVDHVRNGRDGLVEKSREMGATWVTMTVFYWMWLFDDNFNGLIGSYKEALVDDKTKDSLFGMLDYNLKTTPKWMLPRKFNFKNHRTSLKLTNPENQNILKGDTMNRAFGRGPRKTVVFMDEGAHWEYFQDAWTSSGDTTNCRITASTPYGYNAYAQLRDSGIDVMTLHWRLHPLKDDEWYNYERSRRTEEEVAQELDISYVKSQVGRVYPEWDLVEFGDYPFDPELPLFCSWDFGKSDDTAMIWWQRPREGKIRVIDVYWNNGKTIDFYIPFVTGVIPSDGYKYTNRDLELIESHKYWPTGTHFGDPAGRFGNQVVNQTVIGVLRDAGIYVNFREDWKYFNKRRDAAKLLMRDNLVVNDNSRTRYLKVCMINSRYPEVTRQGMRVTNSKDLKPVHDQYSHLRSSFEYGALGLMGAGTASLKVHDKFDFKSKSKNGIRRRYVPY